jgi:hypothetical protein
VAGSTVGYEVGGGLGARGPAEPGAADGVPVSVVSTAEEALAALRSRHALRIDLVAAGRASITPVHTEADDDDRNEAQVLGDKLQQPAHGDWSTTAPEAPRADDER